MNINCKKAVNFRQLPIVSELIILPSDFLKLLFGDYSLADSHSHHSNIPKTTFKVLLDALVVHYSVAPLSVSSGRLAIT